MIYQLLSINDEDARSLVSQYFGLYGHVSKNILVEMWLCLVANTSSQHQAATDGQNSRESIAAVQYKSIAKQQYSKTAADQNSRSSSEQKQQK